MTINIKQKFGVIILVVVAFAAGWFLPSLTGADYESCNVIGITIHGDLVTYEGQFFEIDEGAAVDETSSDTVTALIEEAELNDDVKGILVEVDSFGGSVVAGEEIANDLLFTDKPSVVVIRDIAASSAYWAVTGADAIFASKNSEVGSIGVTASYLDNARKNEKEGLTYNDLSSAKFKDLGDPDKPLTQEERDRVMKDMDILHNNFVEAVALNRGLELEDVQRLADGSTVLGDTALENGLIDGIGSLWEAVDYLEQQIGEEVGVCWN